MQCIFVYILFYICVRLHSGCICMHKHVYSHIHVDVQICSLLPKCKTKPQSMFINGIVLYFQDKFINCTYASILAKDLVHGLQQE